MYCPSCKTRLLKPTKIEQGLPAMGCAHCGGAFVSLLHYRDWREQGHFDSPDACDAESVVDDSTQALACPICSRLMTKYRMSNDTQNRLDLCANCDDVWLDGGEWKLLRALELSHQLPAVFTDVWQYRLRDEARDNGKRERYRQLLGEQDLRELDHIKTWIDGHPQRSRILDYLIQKSH